MLLGPLHHPRSTFLWAVFLSPCFPNLCLFFWFGPLLRFQFHEVKVPPAFQEHSFELSTWAFELMSHYWVHACMICMNTYMHDMRDACMEGWKQPSHVNFPFHTFPALLCCFFWHCGHTCGSWHKLIVMNLSNIRIGYIISQKRAPASSHQHPSFSICRVLQPMREPVKCMQCQTNCIKHINMHVALESRWPGLHPAEFRLEHHIPAVHIAWISMLLQVSS